MILCENMADSLITNIPCCLSLIISRTQLLDTSVNVFIGLVPDL